MPITILGETDGKERDAACRLRDVLSSFIRKHDDFIIVAGAKAYGSVRQDIDLLVLGVCAPGLLIPTKLVPAEFHSRPMHLQNMALTIEVKDHSGDRLRISAANQVEVSYRDGWSNASTQAFQQAHAAKDLLIRNGLESPFWESALWLRNFPTSSLPHHPHNLLAGDLDIEQILKLLVVLRHSNLLWQRDNPGNWPSYGLNHGKNAIARSVHNAMALFRRTIKPTRLDRKRLELVCKKVVVDESAQYYNKLGTQLLMFRGRGGSGKTIRLLQLAYHLREEENARVLILTYNRALVADIQRLFAILGISDRLGERTICIETGHKYFFRLLKAWDMAPASGPLDTFPPDYPARIRDLRELFAGIKINEIRGEQLCCNYPDVYLWDYVLIDEGQDWPNDERDLLGAVFGPGHIVVADGQDQLTRGQQACNWRDMPGVSSTNSQLVSLKKALRLKSNLCRFVAGFATKAGVDWDIEIQEGMAGGAVIWLRGAYTKEFHNSIMSRHATAQNQPVDALFCVTGAGGSAGQMFASELAGWGAEVWDGTTSGGRDAFPVDVNQHRVVNYKSCRGLEGWTCVCLDLDLFYEQELSNGEAADPQLLESPKEVARRLAARWTLIPMTRAIDTLVIQTSTSGPLVSILEKLAVEHSDFVEMIEGPESDEPIF